MADLAVDTVALHGAARSLGSVAGIAEALAAKHGNAASLVSAIGYPRPTMAADSFVSEWTYGAGWIASHAKQSGAYLTTTAQTYEAIEALLAAATSGSAAMAGTAAVAPSLPPLYEPVRPALRVTPGMTMVPASLATARTVRDLIPGEPDLVAILGRRLVGFADELADARIAMMRISLGTWVGASAEACAKDLEELSRRVSAVELAFYTAGDAISAYAPIHAEAQLQASRALALWQAAAPAVAILRGAAVGPFPADAPANPEADLARAGAMLQEAREVMGVAAKTLAERLEDAQRGAPNDPGFFSKIRRAVESFFMGTVEGTVGIAEGVVTLAGLAYRLDPLRAIYDPKGYQETQDALWAGVAHAITHPGEVGAALIDLDTWKDDPAKALGKLAPDIIAILATAGAAGAEKGAEAGARLQSVSKVVEAAQSDGLYRSGPRVASARITELGLDSASPVGRALTAQLESAWAKLDVWTATTFEPGQRFAITPKGSIGAEVASTLPTDARWFFEGQQVPAFRAIDEGAVSQPMYRSKVLVFEVKAPVDGATARALANPELGEGGSTLTYIPDLERAVAEGKVAVVREHHFSPSTLAARMEDPRYRMADGSLGTEALNPTHERIRGFAEGGAEEAGGTARQTAMTVGAGAASDYIDRDAK